MIEHFETYLLAYLICVIVSLLCSSVILEKRSRREVLQNGTLLFHIFMAFVPFFDGVFCAVFAWIQWGYQPREAWLSSSIDRSGLLIRIGKRLSKSDED